ncbi:hypothetical protein PV04_06589 [Phialophora macrospora]|uniref:BHLH domain-containing protein n=1 Tax=Phialophora macrospora TaxID=1851006 RepID=A0A0D2CQA2_9EURO|nr:hypothetical protein PV04_06589 [Phialophora macrospora]
MTYYQDPFFLDQFGDEAYYTGFPHGDDDHHQQHNSATAKCVNTWAAPTQTPTRTQPELYTLKTSSPEDSYVSPYLDALESPFGDTVGPLELQRQQSHGSQFAPLDMDLDLDMDMSQQAYNTPPDDQWPTFGSTNNQQQQPLESIGLSSSPGAGSTETDSPITPTSTAAPMSAFTFTYPQPQPQPRAARTRAPRTASSSTSSTTATTQPRKSSSASTATTRPHPRTKKRNNAPSSSCSSEDDSAIQKAKHAHSIIERRYRDNLNGKMMQLHRVLLVAETDEASKMTAAVTDAAAASPSSLLVDDAKILSPSSPSSGSGRVRKSDIMTRAINYIHRSESHMRHMALELSRLQDQVSVYQKLVKREDGCEAWGGVGLSRLGR